MKLHVNGIEIPWGNDGLNILIQCEHPKETAGPISLTIKGGKLLVEHKGNASLTLTAEDAGDSLILEGHGPVVKSGWKRDEAVQPDVIKG